MYIRIEGNAQEAWSPGILFVYLWYKWGESPQKQ